MSPRIAAATNMFWEKRPRASCRPPRSGPVVVPLRRPSAQPAALDRMAGRWPADKRSFARCLVSGASVFAHRSSAPSWDTVFGFEQPRLALGLLPGSSFSRYGFTAAFEVQPFAAGATLPVAVGLMRAGAGVANENIDHHGGRTLPEIVCAKCLQISWCVCDLLIPKLVSVVRKGGLEPPTVLPARS